MSDNHGVKEETFIQTSKRGRDRQPGWRGHAAKWQLVDQARWRLVEWAVPHLCADKLGGTTGEWEPMQLRVPAQGNKASKTLKKSLWGLRNQEKLPQPHRKVHWTDPQGPRTYTNPPTQESAPEGPNLLVGSGGSDWKRVRAKQVALFPLWPLPHTQLHNKSKWIASPWWIPKALPLMT